MTNQKQLKDVKLGQNFKFKNGKKLYRLSHFENRQGITFAFYSDFQRQGFYISNNLHYKVLTN